VRRRRSQGVGTHLEVSSTDSTHTVHSAYRQSIIPLIRSILFRMLKFIKLVSMSTRYGGPSCVLYLKKRAEDAFSTCLTSSFFDCFPEGA